MTYQRLSVDEPIPGVVLVSTGRPVMANALAADVFDELEQVIDLLGDLSHVRAVVMSGVGETLAQGDASEVVDLKTRSVLDVLHALELKARVLQEVRALRVPVIAIVAGAATGSGLALALAADIRIAGFGMSLGTSSDRETGNGADVGVTWLLTRLVGPAVASEMCFTGRPIEAEEARAVGLVNEVAQDPLARALHLATAIVANSPGGVEMSKRALQANLEIASYAAAVELENRGQMLLVQHPDTAEALAAFAAGRKSAEGGG